MGAEAASLLVRALRQPGLPRDEQVQIRCALAEAWLLQDDVRTGSGGAGSSTRRAGAARSSPAFRHLADTRPPGRCARRTLPRHCLPHQSAERRPSVPTIRGPSDSPITSSGLCYRQVGDMAIVREHITKAASALHAAGDRRHLAMVHSLSGVTRAQEGRLDEAVAALRQAERLAVIVEAGRCAGDGVREPGERRADAASARAGAGARGTKRGPPAAGRHAARAWCRACVARTDLRARRQSQTRGRRVESRARCPKSAAFHARDDRRGVRHACADSSDSRTARRSQPLSRESA